MVDRRWKTAQDQRRVQRRILDNIIQAHAYADLLLITESYGYNTHLDVIYYNTHLDVIYYIIVRIYDWLSNRKPQSYGFMI